MSLKYWKYFPRYVQIHKQMSAQQDFVCKICKFQGK